MNISGVLQGTTYSQAACAFDHLYINDFIGIASRASLQSLLVIKKPTYFDPSRIQSKPVQNYLELSMIWTCSMETHAFTMEVYVVRICIYICTYMHLFVLRLPRHLPLCSVRVCQRWICRCSKLWQKKQTSSSRIIASARCGSRYCCCLWWWWWWC